MSKMEQIQITVTGMSCHHCETRVVKALERLEGVKEAKASAPENSVSVSFDTGKLGIEQLREAILDCGYTPE